MCTWIRADGAGHVCVSLCVCRKEDSCWTNEKIAPTCKVTYCFIHRELLAVTNLPPHLDSVSKETVPIANMV